ncbi:acyltransferase [Globicatella sulfidifaciens]|uniref:Acetyltransferase (Isoleucine patch superfamily) n=1 Tax=Globicatella sulfidifaciens DSM 15739 TaxID=1121925 RepID=A0A1T4NRI1_9LACT|nr:acyltransferase [Globicatella sulfidifaciens]SJZ81782.1 Acetyltransferase (isoleucine patch superfamily) [Globicatella sulfidifaciens DSM 15739]
MNRKRDIIEKHAKIISVIVKISKALPKGFYLRLFKLIRSHDNYIAMFIRFICLKNCAKSCGNNVAIFSNVYLLKIHNLEIGDNVSIHPLCYIDAAGGIIIGNDVSIAHNSTILSEEHKYTDLNMNIKDQGCDYKKTAIEDNVWIGAGCRLLAGTYIESGSIIAAGAVVKNRVKAKSIMGGIPAKLIKERK